MDTANRIAAEVSKLPLAERAAYLDRSCEHDRELRQRVEAILSDASAAEASSDVDVAPTIVADETAGGSPYLAPGNGRYVPEDVIGRGGMGVVVRVRDQDLSRHLAMKVLQTPAGARDTQHRDDKSVTSPHARFLEEAQVTAQLEHPGIVPIHELGTDVGGTPFFTMQLVKGRELNEILGLARREADGWNLSRAVGVLVKVCQAVAYAHSKGVIHRDLKPRNIMVGRFGEVYVMDWGLAKVIGKKDLHDLRLRETTDTILSIQSHRSGDASAAVQEALMTMDGAVVGTPAVMPPEQATGRVEDVDQRSDVYALGAILYALLAGHVPYVKTGDRISARTVLGMVIQGPPQPIREIDPTAPAELVAICEKAMAREQEGRYPTSLELAEDLQAWIDGRVVKAYESGAAAEFKKWISRNRALASSIAAAVALLVAGLVIVVFIQRSSNEKLSTKNEELASANTALELAERTIGEQLYRAQAEQAQLTFVKGLELAERGDIDYGMLWMLEAMKVSPANQDAFKDMVRRNLSAWSALIPKLVENWHGESSVAAFSSDGLLVAFEERNQLRIVDAESGTDIRDPFAFPNQEVTSIAFHPDRPLLAIALAPAVKSAAAENARHPVQFLDVESGREVPPRLLHDGAVSQLFFSRNGDVLYTVDGQGKVISTWDVTTGARLRTKEIDGDRPTRIRLSQDGKQVSLAGGSAAPLDAVSLSPIRSFPHNENVVNHAFHPDGALLVGRRSATGKPLLQLQPGPGGSEETDVFELRGADESEPYFFFPDGSLIFSTREHTIYEWSTARQVGSPLRVWSESLTVGPHCLFALAPTGRWQLPRALSRAAAPVLQEQPPGRLVSYTRTGSEPVQHARSTSVFIHRDDLNTPKRPTAGRLRDAQSGFPITRPLRQRGNGMWDIALSPDGRLAATTVVTMLADWEFRAGETILWDATTGERLHGPLRPCTAIRALEFNHDGTILVGSDSSSTIHFWSTKTGEPIGEPMTGTEIAVSLVFSPDGSSVAAGFGDSPYSKGYSRLFHADTRQPLGDRMPTLGGRWGVFLEFSPSGETLITGDWLAGVVVRNARTGQPRYPPIRPSGSILDTSMSGDGSRFALGDGNGSIRVFDLLTGKQVGRGMQHSNSILSIAMNTDGSLLATGSNEGTVRLWHVATSQPLGPPQAHKYAIWDIQFSNTDSTFRSIDSQGITKHWTIPAAARGTVAALQSQLEAWTHTRLASGVPTLMTKEEWQQREETLSRLAPENVWFSDPVDPFTWHNARAEDAEGDGNWYTALWHLDRRVAAKPDDWRLYARRGRVHAYRGEVSRVEADFAKVAELQSEEALYDWIANCAYDCRERETWEEALAFLQRLVAAEPLNWQWHADQAEAFGELGKTAEQQRAYFRAIQLCDEPFIPHFAEQMAANGKWKTLQNEYARAEKVGWLSLADWKQYARCARELGDLEGYAEIVKRLQNRLGEYGDAAEMLR